MIRNAFTTLGWGIAGLAVLIGSPNLAQAEDAAAKAILERMVKKVGSMSDLHARKDVEYTYLYKAPDGKIDLSVERYILDGEHSWARYVVHEKFVSPGTKGDVVQSYVGGKAQVTIGGEPVSDEAVIGAAAFLRPTNFYWFAMMPKLLDPSVIAKKAGSRTVGGVTYHLVDVTFPGDKSDRYLLYVNPQTGLVDRFLFTVVELGVETPLLMVVEYEMVDGLLLPARRRYAPAKSWEGEVAKEAWTDEIMLGIRFRNGFTPADLSVDGS